MQRDHLPLFLGCFLGLGMTLGCSEEVTVTPGDDAGGGGSGATTGQGGHLSTGGMSAGGNGGGGADPATFTATIQEENLIIDCAPVGPGFDPIIGTFSVVYDNSSGSVPATATITSALLDLTHASLTPSTWSITMAPSGSGTIGPGQTETVEHTKTRGSATSGTVHPCEYCQGGDWSLSVTWNVGTTSISDTLDLGAVVCSDAQ